jgi:rhodanese-related sulfurtransferase
MARALVCGLGLLGSLLLAALAGAGHGDPNAPLPLVPLAELKAQLDGGRRPFLVDLRPAEEFRQGRVPGALSIPIRELRRRYREIPRGRVVLYCDCPREELEAAYRLLVGQGAEQVQALEEPFARWVARGYPLER